MRNRLVKILRSRHQRVHFQSIVQRVRSTYRPLPEIVFKNMYLSIKGAISESEIFEVKSFPNCRPLVDIRTDSDHQPMQYYHQTEAYAELAPKLDRIIGDVEHHPMKETKTIITCIQRLEKGPARAL